MIPMTLRELAAATGARLTPPSAGDVLVDGPVVTDSREAAPGSLYVARVGEHADGHDFIAAARDAGAVAALTSHDTGDLPCLVVAGPAEVEPAFGRLARAVLDRAVAEHGLRVVAVTGSSGKTSTKDLLAQVLATDGETVAPVGSLNGEVGVPLTVCRVSPTTRYLVAEMGARGAGHLTYLTTIAPPDIAVELNVGSAHLGEFGSRAAIARAKAELVQALPPQGLAVLNADDPAVLAMAAVTRARVVTVGLADTADVRAADVALDPLGRASFTLVTSAGTAPVTLQVSGRHQVGNALAVAAAALDLGLTPAAVAAALSGAHAVSRWRMEVTERPDGVTVVNDAYNANPESMRAALAALRAIADASTPPRRTWAVLGEMLELGPDAEQEHVGVGLEAARLGIDHVVAVGAGARGIADGAGEASRVTDGVDPAYDLLQAQLRPGDVVVLKSSRDAGLRWLGDRLAGVEVPS